MVSYHLLLFFDAHVLRNVGTDYRDAIIEEPWEGSAWKADGTLVTCRS